MPDAMPPDAIGYVALHLPELGSWQGFFVLASARERGELLLAEARRAGGGQIIDQGLQGVAPDDQPSIGALSGMLAKLYSLAIATPRPPAARAAAIQSAIGAAGYALYIAAAARWLLVTGSRDEHDPRGMKTTVDPIEAATLDEARPIIQAEIERLQTVWGVVDGFTELVGGRIRPRRVP